MSQARASPTVWARGRADGSSHPDESLRIQAGARLPPTRVARRARLCPHTCPPATLTSGLHFWKSGSRGGAGSLMGTELWGAGPAVGAAAGGSATLTAAGR